MTQSEDTYRRAQKSSIETLPTDILLVESSDYILSIVPPRDALATATRISSAVASQKRSGEPLYYLDLNAISPRSAREIAAHFQAKAPSVKFIDGGIIGGPPKAKDDTTPKTTVSEDKPSSHAWNRPSIPLSGPHALSSAAKSGAHLAETLNSKHISPEIGTASGLKCCFASTSKGFTAICIQAFTTASKMGVLAELQEELSTRMPAQYKAASGAVVAMAPKAYRWVKEMEEIAVTHADEGGFEGDGKGIFDAVAEVYRSVADETVLGEEKTERRKRGLSVEDMASAMGEGLERKRKKG